MSLAAVCAGLLAINNEATSEWLVQEVMLKTQLLVWPPLVFGSFMMLLMAGIACGLYGRPFRVFGWSLGSVKGGLCALFGFWLLAQGINLTILLSSGEPLQWHVNWENPNRLLGRTLASVFGNALWEEMFYRSFLLIEVGALLGRRIQGPRRRLAAAILISQLLFALGHLPGLVLNGSLGSPGSVLVYQLSLLGSGCLLMWLYRFTDNLLIAVAFHALSNSHLLLHTPVSGGPSIRELMWVTLLVGLSILTIHRSSRARSRHKSSAGES